MAATAVARLEHRGPDAGGAWTSQEPGGCHLGHRRLSVLDLSDAGTQPMSDTDGRFHIVYNGEIYYYLELRSALGGSSSFHTGTDTEVLLRAFARWGPGWTQDLIEAALDARGTRRLDGTAVRAAWREYQAGGHDNSFPVWEWISLSLATSRIPAGPDPGGSSGTTILRNPDNAWTA